jgi:hypothetical protein
MFSFGSHNTSMYILNLFFQNKERRRCANADPLAYLVITVSAGLHKTGQHMHEERPSSTYVFPFPFAYHFHGS